MTTTNSFEPAYASVDALLLDQFVEGKGYQLDYKTGRDRVADLLAYEPTGTHLRRLRGGIVLVYGDELREERKLFLEAHFRRFSLGLAQLAYLNVPASVDAGKLVWVK